MHRPRWRVKRSNMRMALGLCKESSLKTLLYMIDNREPSYFLGEKSKTSGKYLVFHFILPLNWLKSKHIVISVFLRNKKSRRLKLLMSIGSQEPYRKGFLKDFLKQLLFFQTSTVINMLVVFSSLPSLLPTIPSYLCLSFSLFLCI